MKPKLTPFVNDRLSTFTEGEIHILLGEDAAHNLHFSLAQTTMLLASRKFNRIVYFNFPFSKRRFTEAQQAVAQSYRDAPIRNSATSNAVKVTVFHLATGRMSDRLHALKDNLDDPKHTALIINSWELASPNYRYREELIFALRELQMELGVTVFVFGVARKPSAVKARQLNHAGLGKLSLAADAVVSLVEEEENSKEVLGASVPLATHPEATLPTIAPGRDTIYGVSTVSKDEDEFDDIDAKLGATRLKTLAELPALEEEATRTGVLRLTIDQALSLYEDEVNALDDKYKIETIREPKKQKSENLSSRNFNDLIHPDEHLSAVEEDEELEYA